jgi:hypothetical protein
MALRRFTLKRRGEKRMRVYFFALSIAIAASAAFANPEDQAARLFTALRERPGTDARAQVAEMLAALDSAGLHNLGTVALSTLAQEGDAALRAAAVQELSRRAADSGLGLALLLRTGKRRGCHPRWR